MASVLRRSSLAVLVLLALSAASAAATAGSGPRSAPGAGADHGRGPGHPGGPPPGVPPVDPPGRPSVPPPATPATLVGFGVRDITPQGDPPGEWAQYLTPNPVNGIWGEPFGDLDADGCYDGATNETLEPLTEGEPPAGGPPEPHVDEPWNSAGDTRDAGTFAVRGVTIVGDPGSTGKWDGIWGGAGFGSQCATGVHDPVGARAVVLEVEDTTVALVSIDVVGFFNTEVRRLREELVARYPDMPVDEIVVSSTHTHQGADTMGYWGQTLGVDGKFPAYQAYIRSQILDAVREAWEAREPGLVKVAEFEHAVGVRDSRPPNVLDHLVDTAQFVRPDGSTIGTVVVWGNHPEAQGGDNGLISSDYPHATRVELEGALGGTAVYFAGSVGGLMTPLRYDVPGFGTGETWERTYEIGRLLAVAAADALAAADPVDVAQLSARRRTFFMDSDNTALRALNMAGVFDIPTFAGARSWGSDPMQHGEGMYAGSAGTQFRTEMVAVDYGPITFLTVPGELSPELEHGGYGRPDCPEADTGRPHEPVIRDQFDTEFLFVLGLGQDELGYIIPGYDFHLYRLPDSGTPLDGFVPIGAEQVRWCGEGHYEETVSASSVMAAWVTCVAAELAGNDPWQREDACATENMHLPPYGIGG